LRRAQLTLGHDSASPVSSRLWKQKQTEFCDKVTEINLKVDRLNMIVPTLYQQIARFDAVKEQQMIATQCREQTELSSTPTYQQQQQQQQQQHESAADSNTVSLTDVLRQLKQLFTT